VSGDAGIGKTALVDRTIQGAAGYFQVNRVVASEAEMELAYAGLQMVCAPVMGSLGRLPDPQREALEGALGLKVAAAPNPFLVGLAVLSLLTDAAEIEPLAVVSLPPVTFALSGTVARTSALFVRRSACPRPDVRKGTLLDTGRQEGALPDPRRQEGALPDTWGRGRERVVLARVGHVGYVTRAGRPVPDPAGDELPAVAQLVLSSTDASAEPDALAVMSESPLVAVVDREGKLVGAITLNALLGGLGLQEPPA